MILVRRFFSTLLVLAGASSLAAADPGSLPSSVPGFTPRVPVSAFARPLAWFDRSRLNVSSTISVGSGFGRGTEGLQVTRLSYQFGTPLSMSVSVGNSFGLGAAQSGRSFFLEGLDLAYRPRPNLFIQVQYRDLRSPLQYSPYQSFGGWGP